jgi:hypothetical protein
MQPADLSTTPTRTAAVIAGCLDDPADLVRLALACPQRFAIKLRCKRNGTVVYMSVADLVAARWLNKCTEHERGWVVFSDDTTCWMGLMYEIQVLRRAAVFSISHERIILSASGSTAVKNTRCAPQGYYWGEGIEDHGRVASSSVIMRKGCHYAQYTLAGPSAEALFGVIRPNYCSPADIERHSSAAGKRRSHSDQGDASDDIEHCFYYARNGTLYPGDEEWRGMRPAKAGDRIGLLLDLGEGGGGAMTVYKNDEWLGVIFDKLYGEYCWAAELFRSGDSVHVQPAAIPDTV